MNKKILLLMFAIIMATLNFGMAISQEKTEDNKSVDLNEYLGARLYKVFTDIGVPDDVVCSADGANAVIMDYGVFGLQIEDKLVSVIYFWDNFPGEVFGNKIGITKKDVEEKYGKPDQEKNSSIDSSLIWIYAMKDTDRYFVMIFDDNAKVKRYQIELMK